MNVTIIDDFATDEAHDKLLGWMDDTERPVPWYWLPSASGKDSATVPFEYGFYHVAYRNNMIMSPLFDLALPILERIEAKEIMRVRFGMQTNIGTEGHHGIHTDMDEPHETLLYYLGDSDGDTLFFQGGEIALRNPHTRNQAVIFGGDVPHASSPPIKHARRLTVNVNYRRI